MPEPSALKARRRRRRSYWTVGGAVAGIVASFVAPGVTTAGQHADLQARLVHGGLAALSYGILGAFAGLAVGELISGSWRDDRSGADR